MKLFIKNMVCSRCKLFVKDELEKLFLQYKTIELGEVDIISELPAHTKEILRINLHKFGLELIDDKKTMLIEKIKTAIIEQIHYDDEPLNINFSTFISEKLHYDYTYLANLFSELQGSTIEKFIITHKIERVKELLVYNELSLTAISYLMHYSSVSHLSNQFKKTTGLTPSHFKNLKQKKLVMLDVLQPTIKA